MPDEVCQAARSIDWLLLGILGHHQRVQVVLQVVVTQARAALLAGVCAEAAQGTDQLALEHLVVDKLAARQCQRRA